MISTNIHLSQEAKQILIKAAAFKQISVEDLASEIINEVIQDKLSPIIKDTETKPKRKPALAGTEPFVFYGTPEESGLPADEWDMEKE
jgi:S-adenosylmethionine synthetase